MPIVVDDVTQNRIADGALSPDTLGQRLWLFGLAELLLVDSVEAAIDSRKRAAKIGEQRLFRRKCQAHGDRLRHSHTGRGIAELALLEAPLCGKVFSLPDLHARR